MLEPNATYEDGPARGRITFQRLVSAILTRGRFEIEPSCPVKITSSTEDRFPTADLPDSVGNLLTLGEDWKIGHQAVRIGR